LFCSFTRQISLNSQQNYFDLNNPYYLFAAYGYLDSNGIQNFKFILYIKLWFLKGNMLQHNFETSSKDSLSYRFSPQLPLPGTLPPIGQSDAV
jgi:hypothetical protein